MHRLTAKLLLFLALVGNLAPPALAATAAPPHACCVRRAVHHCHDSVVSESYQFVIRDAGYCNHDCCRAATSARSAQAQPTAFTPFENKVEAYLGHSSPLSPNTEVSCFQSTRAPPAC
jgi:hypothetical protein